MANPITSPRLTRMGLCLCLSLPLVPTLAHATPKTAAKKQSQAPLLDRELFFGNPEIGGSQLSPDGTHIAFMKPYKDTLNVWVKKTGEPYEKGRLLTDSTTRPIGGFFWSRDGKRVLFVKDHEGDENFNVYAVDPKAPNASGKAVPEAKNLTDAKKVQAAIYSVPKNDPDTLFVGLNDRDASWHDLYKVKLSTGERTLIRKNTDRIAAWVFDQKGQLRLAMRTEPNGDSQILKPEGETFKPIYTTTIFESASPVHFHKDGQRVYMETNKGARDLSELVLFDPETGKEEKVESDPKNRVDFGRAMFSDLTEEMIATVYEDDKTRIEWKDKAWQADYEFLQKKLPGKDIGLGSMTEDENLLLITTYSDQDPGSRYLFNRKTKKLTLEYVSRPNVPREHMAQMEPIRYPSSDGLEIPAYLTLPKGVKAEKLPLVVMPHGGPWARDSWGFSGNIQFLANRGYAVLQPNFRASTGYGKKFLNAGNLQWGDKMQDDITWGVKHLVDKGIVDKDRVGIMGGSYGGYAALAGAAFTPDLFKASVPIVGPSNLLTLLESIPPYWESFRVTFHERMGNPNTPEGKARLERQSPLNSAHKIKIPMLIVQGANDPRVKKAESDQIVVALREKKADVEYLCAPDEGHGFRRPVNNMAMMASAEKFLAKHLKGRFQEGGKPEVMQRLKEITVDPKTVVLAKKIENSSISLPKVAHQLKTGKSAFKGELSAGERKMPLTFEQEILETPKGYEITRVTQIMGTELKGITTLHKDTLAVSHFVIQQGPVEIKGSTENGKIQGTMSIQGNAKPIDMALEGELFADFAGGEDVIATLPLTEGFTATFRNFDAQKQKITVKEAKVVSQETLQVAGKPTQTWKVEITGQESGKQTVWVDQTAHQVMKSQEVLPEMNGAVITVERTL